jgi:serine/threonine protein phosphatase PrpC
MAVDFVRSNVSRVSDADSCAELLRKMDAAISADRVAGETTCVIAVVGRGTILGASVGDSGARMIMPNGECVDLTRSQQRKPFVGTGAAGPMPFKRSGPGGLLLLATDGLLKYNSPEGIAKICLNHPPEDAARRLVESVRYPSGRLPDDVTLILAAGEA